MALILMIATLSDFSHILAVPALRCDSFDGSPLYNTLLDALGPFVNPSFTEYCILHVLPSNTAIDFLSCIVQSSVASQQKLDTGFVMSMCLNSCSLPSAWSAPCSLATTSVIERLNHRLMLPTMIRGSGFQFPTNATVSVRGTLADGSSWWMVRSSLVLKHKAGFILSVNNRHRIRRRFSLRKSHSDRHFSLSGAFQLVKDRQHLDCS
jgi:hypothetical protein